MSVSHLGHNQWDTTEVKHKRTIFCLGCEWFNNECGLRIPVSSLALWQFVHTQKLWNNLQCWCKMWNEHLQADQGLWPWVRCLSPGSARTDPSESHGGSALNKPASVHCWTHSCHPARGLLVATRSPQHPLAVGLQNLPQILCPGQNTLSSLTSSKVVRIIFRFWSLCVTSLTHSSKCHTKVSQGYLGSLCSNKTHVPFISPFVKTCRYFYQTHSFMSFIEQNSLLQGLPRPSFVFICIFQTLLLNALWKAKHDSM